MVERPIVRTGKHRISTRMLDLAFVRLAIVDHVHDVLALTDSTADHALAHLVMVVFAELRKEQGRLFNELMGPTPIGVLIWAPLPLDKARTTRSLKAVIRAAAGNPGVSPGRFLGEHAGLTILPLIGVEDVIVEKGRTPDGSRRPADAEDAPTLPAIPVSIEELAESAGLILARQLSSLDGNHSEAFSLTVRSFETLRAAMARALEGYLARKADKEFGSFAENQKFVTELQQSLEQLGLRVACGKDNAPSTLVLREGTARNGAFAFRHTVTDEGRRTHHGGKATLPLLTLVRDVEP